MAGWLTGPGTRTTTHQHNWAGPGSWLGEVAFGAGLGGAGWLPQGSWWNRVRFVSKFIEILIVGIYVVLFYDLSLLIITLCTSRYYLFLSLILSCTFFRTRTCGPNNSLLLFLMRNPKAWRRDSLVFQWFVDDCRWFARLLQNSFSKDKQCSVDLIICQAG